jgi:hypothetical protein
MMEKSPQQLRNSMAKKKSKQKEPKISTKDILDKLDWEGDLVYLICDYYSPEQIEDPRLAKAWGEAKKVLDVIKEIFNEEELDPNVSA